MNADTLSPVQNVDPRGAMRQWRQTLDAKLPTLAGSSPSAIRLQVAGNPGAREALEREWTDAAAKALAATGDVDCAFELLGGVRSLRDGLLPGARCFHDFNDASAVHDCRNHVIQSMPLGRKAPAGGKLVIVKLERNE